MKKNIKKKILHPLTNKLFGAMPESNMEQADSVIRAWLAEKAVKMHKEGWLIEGIAREQLELEKLKG